MRDECVALPAPGTLAAPTGDELSVWWALVPVGRLSAELRAELAADVDLATIARVDRFHRVEDRDRGLAAHALLRRLLAAVVGGRPAAIVLARRCLTCGQTDHGKPYLDVGTDPPPVELNLSHSGRLVCAVLAAPGVSVGVDVEERRAVNWTGMRRSVFTDVEWSATEAAAVPDRARTDFWARKEAAVKATGHGLSLPPRDVHVTMTGVDVWTAGLPAGAGRVVGTDLTLTPEAAAALGVHQPDPIEVAASMPAPTVHRVRLGVTSSQ